MCEMIIKKSLTSRSDKKEETVDMDSQQDTRCLDCLIACSYFIWFIIVIPIFKIIGTKYEFKIANKNISFIKTRKIVLL